MQMDCGILCKFVDNLFLFGLSRLITHFKQIGSNMKSGTWLQDWLLELGKLANGMAEGLSSPTRQDMFKRSCVCRLLKSIWCCPDMTQLITNLTMLTCHLSGHAATALVVENVPKYLVAARGLHT